MIKIATVAAAALLVGYLIAFVVGTDINTENEFELNANQGNLASTEHSNLEARIIALETQLLEERIERERLQDLVESYSFGQWDLATESNANRQDGNRNISREQNLPAEDRRQMLRERNAERQASAAARRLQRLENAGFSSERADWILKREEEMRLQNLNAQWEQRRQTFLAGGEAEINPLRQELGDIEYEQYLEATGRSTSVFVSNVMDNSQATNAGFQAGDEIVRYDGMRVFNFNELNMANVQGQLGEPVMIDIIRDGTPMQLSVERGPLGIVGGRQRGYRRR